MRRSHVEFTFCYCLVVAAVTPVSEGFQDLNWSEDDADKDIVFPVRIEREDGVGTTNLWPSGLKWAGRNRRDALGEAPVVYQLSGFGVDYELQMAPNEVLLSPSAFVQTIDVGNAGSEEILTEEMVDEGCHLHGWVFEGRGENSRQWGQAAISVCDGNMTGVLRMPGYDMHIEAAEGGNSGGRGGAHVLQRRSTGAGTNEEKPECHVTRADDVGHNESRFDQHHRSERDTFSRTTRRSARDHTLYVETLIVVDKYVINKRRMTDLQLRNYVLSLMNIANLLWADKATGFDVRFVVLRLVLLRSTPSQLTLSKNSLLLMRSFCAWQHQINSPNEASKAHHDYAILLTGNELCATGNVACGELGRAYVEAMCRPEYSCQVAYDSGVRGGFVIAHEAGHSFGMFHDGDGNYCSSSSREIMSPQVSGQANLYHWSSCSKQYVEKYLRKEYNFDCLLDEPPTHTLQYPSKWTGARYDLDDQCSFQVGRKSTFCQFSWAKMKICQALWCSEGRVCTTVYIPAADGSTCGTNQVCIRGQCVPESEKENYTRHDSPVHGSWSDWSVFSECSRSCGGGIQYQQRYCTSPKPRNGGRECEGQRYSLELCNKLPCPDDSENERRDLCLNKKDSDGNLLQPLYKDNRPCSVYCYDVAKRRQRRQKAVLLDGARCYPNKDSNDRCFKGRCEKFGCDDQWKSTVARDKCGVCLGTGRSCTVQVQTLNHRVSGPGYYAVCSVPKHARDIVVKEVSFSNDVYLAVKLETPDQYVLNGKENDGAVWQNVKAAGTVIDYSRPAYGIESIKIAGPVQQRINAMAYFTPSGATIEPNVTCQYSLSSNITEPKHGLVLYVWKRKVSPCSKTCRGGTQTVTYYCHVPRWGMAVEHRFCGAATPPKIQTVLCNTDVICDIDNNDAPPPGPSYRWRVDAWGQCSTTCGNGEQKGVLHCYDDTSAEDVEISRCQDPPPSSSRTCKIVPCPLDGSWTQWKSSVCTKTCGSGVQLESRTCTNPSPQYGGKYCSGQSKRHRCCNTQACKHSYGNFTDELTMQCRKLYPNSVAEYKRIDLRACRISCRLEDGTVRGINAESGTRCDLRSANRCLNGVCWLVGCDCLYGSSKKPTSCGLCSDDSAHCVTVMSKYRIRQGMAGYYHVLDVPKNAYQVHVRVLRRSKLPTSIMMRSFGGGAKLNSAEFKSTSEYRFLFGGEVSYRYIAASQEESVFFYGPTENDFEIFLHVTDFLPEAEFPHVDVSYVISSALKDRVDEITELHGWTVAKTGCSAGCGTGSGYEKWEARCALKETGVYVNSELCSLDYRPVMVEGPPCNASGNCLGMMWKAADWSSCGVSCGLGQQIRHVDCVAVATSQRVDSHQCDESLKPSTSRECVNPNCVELVPHASTPTNPVPVVKRQFVWHPKQWKSCSVSCNRGVQVRTVRCIDKATRKSKRADRCKELSKPSQRRVCNERPCPRPTAAATTAAIVETVLPTTILPRTRIVPFSTARPTLTTFAEYAWITKSWTLCSVTCGTGYQKRRVRCVENATRTIKQDSLCDAESVPVSFKQCSLPPCPSASDQEKCQVEPGYCRAVRDHRLCNAPNFKGKCCRSC